MDRWSSTDPARLFPSLSLTNREVRHALNPNPLCGVSGGGKDSLEASLSDTTGICSTHSDFMKNWLLLRYLRLNMSLCATWLLQLLSKSRPDVPTQLQPTKGAVKTQLPLWRKRDKSICTPRKIIHMVYRVHVQKSFVVLEFGTTLLPVATLNSCTLCLTQLSLDVTIRILSKRDPHAKAGVSISTLS